MADAPKITNEDEPEKVDVADLHAPVIREKLEPKDGFEPVPLWLVGVFAVVVFWGGYYLATYNGGWSSSFSDGDPAPLLGASAAPAGPVDPVVLGKKIYSGNCVSCHQADGLGQAGQYPPLAGSEFVLDPKHEPHIKRILLLGLQGPVTVKGSSYNGNMPPFAAKLKDEQIAAVLTYVRQEWGNKAAPITPEEIAAARTSVGPRSDPWVIEELMKIGPDAPVKVAAPVSQPAK